MTSAIAKPKVVVAAGAIVKDDDVTYGATYGPAGPQGSPGHQGSQGVAGSQESLEALRALWPARIIRHRSVSANLSRANGGEPKAIHIPLVQGETVAIAAPDVVFAKGALVQMDDEPGYGPTGPQGAQGAMGIQGMTGPQGYSGSESIQGATSVSLESGQHIGFFGEPIWNNETGRWDSE